VRGIGLRKTDEALTFEQGGSWSACSLRGPSRPWNADALAVVEAGRRRAFAVADGVGALALSPAASRAAVDAAARWACGTRGIARPDAAALVREVNEAVRRAVTMPSDGATTLVCALVDQRRAAVVSVGDSEVFAVDEAGAIARINPLDHVPAQPNLLLAWIDGDTEIEPHVTMLEHMPARLVLLTDGVTRVLGEEIIGRIASGDAREAARDLVLAAQAAGADDDATAVVLTGAVRP